MRFLRAELALLLPGLGGRHEQRHRVGAAPKALLRLCALLFQQGILRAMYQP